VEAAIVQYPDAKTILMRQHGALCMAEDFEKAFEIAQALEEVSKKEFDRVVTIPLPQNAEAEHLLKDLRSACPELQFGLEADAAVQAVAAWKKTLRPHLDDLAQIAGVRIRSAQKDPAAIVKAMKHSNAVLVPGVGAVCCAKDPEDLWAIQMIMRKSAMAALYAQACSAAPLSPVDRRIMRFVYTMKYAKKKTEQ
jgi:L-fuculose-phosphate aldolase